MFGLRPGRVGRMGVVGGTSNSSTLRSSLMGGTVPSGFTFTRASSGTYFDALGVMQTAANDVARFDFGPTPTNQRTNIIFNNTMVGAVPGTPGTRPTGWTIISANGIAIDVAGVGVENGIEYTDWRFYGTSTATGSNRVYFTGSGLSASPIPSGLANNTISSYMRMVGGSMNGVTGIKHRADYYDVAGTFIGSTGTSTPFAITNAPLDSQRYSYTFTPVVLSVLNRSGMQFEYNNAFDIDITIRIGLPQNEAGTTATLGFNNAPAIRTSGTAVTTADLLGLLVEDARTNSLRNNSNTGAVVGDPVTPVELVTNGGFALDPINASQNTVQNGWQWSTVGGTSTAAWSSNAVTLTGDGANNVRVDTSITTVIGVTYTLTVDVTTNAVFLQIGTTQGGVTLYNAAVVVGTAQKVQFTATATTTWFRFGRTSAGATTIDNVSTVLSRITNGDFALDPINAAQNTLQNGWQWNVTGGASTVTWTSNAVNVISDGAFSANLDTSITTVVGTYYTVIADVATSVCTLQVGTTQGGSTLFNANLPVGTSRRATFTATSTTTWIRFRVTVASTSTIDNVSVIAAGVPPTNWGNFLNALSGNAVSTRIVGVGTESGISYIDWHMSGTGDGVATRANMDSVTLVTSALGDTWTHSMYVSLVSGSASMITLGVEVREYNAGSGLTQSSVAVTPTTGGLATRRYSHARTTTDATITHVMATLRYVPAVGAIDLVLRIGMPQLEAGYFPTSVIATTTVAVTRALDSCLQTPIGGWYRQSAPWTVKFTGIVPQTSPSGASVARFASIDDGTTSNRIVLRNSSGLTTVGVFAVSAGVTAQPNAGTALTINTVFKLAASNDGSNVRTCMNGGSVGSSASTGYPVAPTRASIGHSYITAPTNGWVREFEYWPRGLSASELQQITT